MVIRQKHGHLIRIPERSVCNCNNNKKNNNKVNLYSAITMQIYSTALLENSSMLGQCQIIYQVMYKEIIDTFMCEEKLAQIGGFLTQS